MLSKTSSVTKSKPKGEGCIEMYQSSGLSMWPCISHKDVLIVKKVPLEELKLGDLIVFYNVSQISVVHRLIEITKTKNNIHMLHAKGDINFFFDKPIPYKNIIGKVYFIKKTNSKGKSKLIDQNTFFRKIISYTLACSAFAVYKAFHFFR